MSSCTRLWAEAGDLPPISHPFITGVSVGLTCTGKLSRKPLGISTCVVRFVPG